MQKVDLLIKNAKELLTLASDKPKTGKDMQDLGIINDGAVAVDNGKIVAVGTTTSINREYKAQIVLDASDKVVMPGFIDPHTHPVFVNTRENEFEMRLQGKTYKEISQSGGGIRASINDVRKASKEELLRLSVKRVSKMLAQGTTTIEAKSGYGLSLESEIKMLEAINELDEKTPIDVISTFLGAHEYPEEYKENHEKYIEIIINKMLPEVVDKGLADYCDIFCEEHVFDIEESRRILRHAKKLGFKIRMHADELEPIGGAELAAELGAISADHLVAVSDEGIKQMKKKSVIPILLP
ncbi:MAG: imidazolonepropionase, partial [Candidatus Cloacimonetes bacterium]|nr:imidazolonepropionase [Candidatus Cloacimonadota bacterium]